MIVVSSCLAGIPCRYDKSARPNHRIIALVRENEAVAACPECLAGLKRPSPPAEIIGGDGEDVLSGVAKVYNKEGEDITDAFIAGAWKFLEFVRAQGATKVFLKSNSPSCGVCKIYDGTFSGNLVDGCGVTCALLKRNGIQVVEVD